MAGAPQDSSEGWFGIRACSQFHLHPEASLPVLPGWKEISLLHPAGILVSSGLSWLEALTEGFHLCLEDGTEIKAVLLLPEEPVPILNPFSAIKPARPEQLQQITASSAEWGGESKPFLSWS